jgi:Ion channel
MQESDRLSPDSSPTDTTADHPARTGVRRLSVTHFLIALILLLGIVPFVDQLPYGGLIEAILLTLALLLAVMAVGGRQRTLIAAAILVTPAVAGKWIDHFRPGLIPRGFTTVAAIVFVAFVVVHLFRFILRAPRVTDETLHAAIAAYLLLGLLWSFAYLLLSSRDPAAFAIGSPPAAPRPLVGYEALFLSFGTLSNVGYDDVHAASKPARMLMMAQGMTGIFYVAIVISRLVALYSGYGSAESQRTSQA